MTEHNYVVYIPTPLGKGIIVAVFVNEYEANIFAENSFDEYAIVEVEVDGNTSIRRYMDLIKEEK